MPTDEMEYGVEDVEGVKADEAKGPGTQWSDEARAKRGAEVTPEQMGEPEPDSDGNLPKGPDPEEWGDEARVERGAQSPDEV